MIRRFHRQMNALFPLSITEAKGFMILFMLCALVGLRNRIFPHFYTQKGFGVSQESLDSLVVQWEENVIHTDSVDSLDEVELFEFDPNTATFDDFVKLGLTEKVARTIINFRNKGGSFRSKEDLKKIYGLDELAYATLEPFIRIKKLSKKKRENNETAPPVKNKFEDRKAKLEPFDINLADTAQLKRIYGIGSVLSKRIIKFRDRLGGFVNISQLEEVYGLKERALENAQKYAFVSDSFSPSKLNINLLSKEELAAHPYLNRTQAGAIVNFREINGNFEDLKALTEVQALPADLVEKLGPYLDFSL